MYNYTRG